MREDAWGLGVGWRNALRVRRETGKEQVVQVHYDEGAAVHIGPEPCVVVREGRGEASAGDRIGQPLVRQAKLARSSRRDDWLPKPKILHPWPDARFAVRHPRWEPYALIGPVRICAGGVG